MSAFTLHYKNPKQIVVKKYTKSLITLFVLLSITSFGQSGGNSTYDFLTLNNSARIAAMGGNFLTVKDNDINVAVANPSLITSEMHNNLSLSYVDYFTDINFGYATYGYHTNKLGNFVGTVHFIDYGKFQYADESGATQGNFAANEYSLNLGWGRSLDSNFSIGANLKGIMSNFESYGSFGLAVDVAGTYHNPKSNLTASVVFSNIGRQITYYYGENQRLPFEIKAGVSKTLQHIPLTFSVLFTNLQRWDLRFDQKDETSSFNEDETTKTKTGIAEIADEAMRHIVLGAELRPFKILRLRAGYNYLLRKEMLVDAKPGTIGWSWGLGVKVYQFEISYARKAQYLGPSYNFFTVTTNLNTLFHVTE
jgi:hypothetical protein